MKILNNAIKEKGSARLLLSTGASQFDFFASFVNEKVDWSKVVVFHLDEYVGISPELPATLLRTHPDATLYCDENSASLIGKAE